MAMTTEELIVSVFARMVELDDELRQLGKALDALNPADDPVDPAHSKEKFVLQSGFTRVARLTQAVPAATYDPHLKRPKPKPLGPKKGPKKKAGPKRQTVPTAERMPKVLAAFSSEFPLTSDNIREAAGYPKGSTGHYQLIRVLLNEKKIRRVEDGLYERVPANVPA